MKTLRIAIALVASFGAFACSAADSGSTLGGGGGAGGNGGAAGFGGFGAAGSDGGIFDANGGDGDNGGLVCSAASQFIYVIDEASILYKFDPPSLALTAIGPVKCPTLASPFSMAVDRNGHAWTVFDDGTLYKVDTSNAACTSTGFVAGQSGFTTFGMGFSTDGPGSTHDTLFVSGDTAGNERLATIDTQTLVLSPVGPYDQISARAELTGTGDGRLFGAFEGSPYVVAEIQKSTAHISSQAPQTPIQYSPGSSNFAFAFWGGDFWLFVGPGTKTDVFHYSPGSGTTVLATSVPQVIVGAGVSTCAPLKPPS